MKNKNIKAAFFDVDGTLYDHEKKEIPPLHLEMLKRLKQEGIRICLCSGRAWPLLQNLGILSEADWDGFVCGNGSYVYDKEGVELFKNVIPKKSAYDIFDRAEKQQIGLFVAGNCAFCTRDDGPTRQLLNDFSIVGVPFRDKTENDEFCIISLAVSDTRKRRPEFESIPDIQILYNEASIDIMRKDLSKYEGIKVLMDHFGFNEHDYMAFGDALNDLEMLENASLGAAMADGDARVLAKIENHCPSVKEAGIYTFLKENFFREQRDGCPADRI